MSITGLINTTFGTCLILILIAADYLRKYNTDNFQRKLLIILLSSIITAAVFNFIGNALEISGAGNTGVLLFFVWSIYFIGRNCSFYYAITFIDYFSHGNIKRTKSIFKVISIFLVFYTLTLAPNFYFEYYFHISTDNAYIPGPLNLLQLFISYIPVIIILINISLAQKEIKRIHFFLTAFFVIVSAIGAAIDVMAITTNLIWPCITAAALYIYFFIIRSDSDVDSLTGIGTRSSFYEYVNKLNKELIKKNYAFVKIDLDRFREINDTLGYLEGDKALRNIASIIKNCIRKNDFAARFGGDEFILITTEENDIQRIINRINDSLNNQNKKHKRPYQINMSYIYDVYTTNSGFKIQDFLAQMDKKLDRIREKQNNEEKDV